MGELNIKLNIRNSNFYRVYFLSRNAWAARNSVKIRKNVIKQTKFQSKPRKFNIFAPLVYNVFDDFFRNKVEKVKNLWIINLEL